MSEETTKIVLPPSAEKKMYPLYLNGEIDNSTYTAFANTLSAAAATEKRDRIILNLSSVGGCSLSSLCAVDVLKAWPKEYVVIAGGMVASAATYILASGNFRLAYTHAAFLFHPAVSTMEFRNKAEATSALRHLDNCDDAYYKIYQECIGLTKKEAEKLTANENYLNAIAALNLGTRGLIDGVILKLLDGFKYEILMRGGVRKVVDLANDDFNDARNLTVEAVKNPDIVTTTF